MLSNPLQRFSQYHSMPSSTLFSNGHGSSNHTHGTALNDMPSGYGIHQLQHAVGVHDAHLARSSPHTKSRQHPYGPSGRASSTSGPIRRRISRACDQCNQLRTKCDGQHPCAHCIEFGLGCEYVRERKKRGKASRKDLAQQAAAQAAASAQGQRSDSDEQEPSANTETSDENLRADKPKANSHQQIAKVPRSEDPEEDASQEAQRTSSLETIDEIGSHQPQQPSMGTHFGMDGNHLEGSAPLDLNGYGGLHGGYDRPGISAPIMNGPNHATYEANQNGMAPYSEMPYSIHAQTPASYPTNPQFRLGNTNPIGTYSMGEATSPGWMDVSPTAQYHPALPQPNYGHGSQQLRYPVLEPLIPHLNNIVPLPLACDLIDVYFASSSSAQMHPMSPYVLGYVFRKRSFLHPKKPRHCQPALLASMLWVAAQTSDAPFLSSVPAARAKTCQKLLELTVSLLNPLIHTPSGEGSPAASPAIGGVALGGLGVALPGSMSLDALTGECGAFGAAGKLDDVITYIHLATVVSASEYKGASLRWWNAAWSLARELKLGRELPPAPPNMSQGQGGLDAEGEPGNGLSNGGTSTPIISEEEREERRRIWWLTYIVDRHLALCYNRPLFLLDLECSGLLQPMDDMAWQNGDFDGFTTTDPSLLPSDQHQQTTRVRGPHFECTGHSIFGYFLPLMTILGEVVDLHHARNHPRFGVGFRSAQEWDDQTAEITRHLHAYEHSLQRFEKQNLGESKLPSEQQHPSPTDASDHHGGGGADIGTPSVHSVHTNASNRMTESDIQTKIVMAYGTHVMHVLHILLSGKWDPINLLDDNDLWISSQGFIDATAHAVSAAEAINSILEYDPGLEFMPFFFGIYLLQGSFLLLLIADKLQVEASPSVVKACETIVRAHEACVVTLSTEYQRNFSKVMRSALAQVRGRVPEDLGEQHQRRRELLSLYRWTGDGTGLAL